MSKLPPSLYAQNLTPERAVCLILEGFEEEYYFKRLMALSIFSPVYRIIPINAKTASNIPVKYKEAFASNSHHIVLVVCDMDRIPDSYNYVV